MKTRIFSLAILLIMTAAACKPKAPVQPEQAVQPEVTTPPADSEKMILARAFIKPEKVIDFIESAKSIIESSNKEEGCIYYRLYQDPYEKTNFIFVEKYKSQAAIDFHFATPYFSEFGTKIADWTAAPTEIKIIDIAGER